MKKELIPFKDDLPQIIEKFKTEFKEAKANDLDGVRFDWKDGSWINIRPSNTEPIIKIFGEAKTEDRLDEIFKRANLTLESK